MIIKNPIVYYIKGLEELSPKQENFFLENVHEDKVEKIKRLAFAIDRSRSILGLMLLDKILKDNELNDLSIKQIRQDKLRKPAFPAEHNPHNIDFNITHSGALVACVVAQNIQVGLDSEYKQNKEHRLSSHFMTEEEINYISADNNTQNEDRFLEIWTKKEALIKADPDGKIMQLKSIKLSNNTESSSNKMTGVINNNQYHLSQLDLDNKAVTHLASSIEVENIDCIAIKQDSL